MKKELQPGLRIGKSSLYEVLNEVAKGDPITGGNSDEQFVFYIHVLFAPKAHRYTVVEWEFVPTENRLQIYAIMSSSSPSNTTDLHIVYDIDEVDNRYEENGNYKILLDEGDLIELTVRKKCNCG